jgi:hypothetical protein
VSIVGWGRTCVTCPGSDVLRGVQNNIISNAECRTFYGNTVTDQFFCMQTTGQRGTCPGDSGGPYTLPRPGPSDQLPVIQIGVHSFGASSAVGGCEGEESILGFCRLFSFFVVIFCSSTTEWSIENHTLLGLDRYQHDSVIVMRL